MTRDWEKQILYNYNILDIFQRRSSAISAVTEWVKF